MNQDLRRKLDRITNALFAGGVTNPITYIEQISYLIFLKLLDEEEVNRVMRSRLGAGNGKLLFPGQAERFRWSKWRFKSGNDLRNFIRDQVFPYMASLVKDEPQVAEYFRDAVLEITDPNVLKIVIDELDSIEFKKLGPDVKGDIYEYLMTYLGKIDSSTLGQFRTPKQIRAFMVAMVDPDFGDTIYDPACGTAGFLIDAVDYLLAKYSEKPIEIPIYGEEWLEKKGMSINEAKKANPNLQTYRKGAGEKIPDWGQLESAVYGTDVSRQMMRISMMNLVLHGIGKAKVKRANVLSEHGGLTEDDLNRKYKVILSNPPFAGILPKESIRHDLPTSSKKSELLFLGLMMECLAPGGRCAIVVPEGTLYSLTGAHKDLRKKLLHDFEINAVVSLPPGVFKPYAGVKTSIVFFRKPSRQSNADKPATDRVWFYEISNDGYDPEKIQSGGRPETPELNDIPELLNLWKAYKESGFNTTIGEKAGTLLPPDSPEPKYWWADYDTVKESDYDLSSTRYKPGVSEVSTEENPVEIIQDILVSEQKMMKSFEDLLRKVEKS